MSMGPPMHDSTSWLNPKTFFAGILLIQRGWIIRLLQKRRNLNPNDNPCLFHFQNKIGHIDILKNSNATVKCSRMKFK